MFTFHVEGLNGAMMAATLAEVTGVKVYECKVFESGLNCNMYTVDYFSIDEMGIVRFDGSADSEEIEQMFDALEEKGYTARCGAQRLDKAPEGWTVIKGASNPVGCTWYSNNESRFSGKRRHVLVKN